MATNTPAGLFPVPSSDGSDNINKIGQLVNALGAAVENVMIVATDSKSVADAYSTYPIGVSLMGLTQTGATNGAWPELFSSYVVTMRRLGGDAAAQFHITNRGGSGTPSFRVRNGNGNGWTDWLLVAGNGQTKASASGVYTFNNANSPRTATVAFPANTFSTAPNVVVSTHDRSVVAGVTGISSTGFTILLGANGGGSSFGLANYNIEWIAIAT
jgi:hypothetical protein